MLQHARILAGLALFLVDLKRKASVLLADDCILQADCNGNVCAAVTNNASCVTTGEEAICLINLLHRRAAFWIEMACFDCAPLWDCQRENACCLYQAAACPVAS